MTRRTAWLNARLLCPATKLDCLGGVLVEDGRISDLGAHITADSVGEVVAHDCGGAVLAPGLFDLRVRAGEPGETQKEDFHSAAAAAAAGGITSMVLLPDGEPVIDNDGGLAFVERRARRQKSAKIFAWATITRDASGEALADLGLLSEAGALGFTDGDKPVANARLLLQALRYGRAFNLLIAQRPEETSLGGGVMNGGAIAARLGLSGIPAAAEVIGLERDLRLVELTDARYHAAQISTAGAVEVLRAGKKRGLPITADTSPQYFLLTEREVESYRTFARLTPPLRTEADRIAVAEAVADGTIDAIASAHNPQDQESKRVPFEDAEPGIVGLETLLGLSYELVRQGLIELPELLLRLSTTPAAIVGRRAELVAGAAADFVVFDPLQTRTIDATAFRSRSQNTLFDGRDVQAVVLQTCVDGRIVFDADAPDSP